MTKQLDKIEELTRQAVKEVFDGMLSMKVSDGPPTPLPNDAAGQIIGSVGFIGKATGVIHIYAGLGFATVITSRMLGLAESEIDSSEMVNDAIGELSNMIVGQVKSRLCDAGWPCTLTIPSIVRGQHLSVEGSSQILRKIIGFHNCTHHFLAELLLKEPTE